MTPLAWEQVAPDSPELIRLCREGSLSTSDLDAATLFYLASTGVDDGAVACYGLESGGDVAVLKKVAVAKTFQGLALALTGVAAIWSQKLGSPGLLPRRIPSFPLSSC